MIEGVGYKIGEVAEIGFFDGAGFQAQGQSVRVGGNGDGGDFEKLLLEITAAGLLNAEFGVGSAE